ncbi:glycosyl transferase group 1 [Crinalium epipsammum PCC 9333]|uniref:Glycosyl transferase group 1 n=2 Tax=Crinalium TaxID=241421 RepID=K9W1K0_9CYAN|nr:glycosyl transferase group 1 [Crinalium epipsammum PCC 9333]
MVDIAEKPDTDKKFEIICVGMGWFPHEPGGLNRYVYELTHALAASQDRVELCGLGIPEGLENYPLKLTNLAEADSPIWQRLWFILQNFLKRKSTQPNAINLHFALYSFPVLQVLPKHVPITFTFHGPWALESQLEGTNQLGARVKHWLEKIVYHRCDRFIVLSKAFGTILHQEYQVPWSKIHIIPGGVDLSRFQPNLSRQEARTQLNWPQDRPILFTPRRLVHRVGLDKLLTAIATIKPQLPDVWLAIAGKGPLQAVLEQQATDLGLNDNVKFLGFLPDEQLPIAYQAADLTVMPSQSLEGFGLVVLESLACGTPTLCTPVGGMPEILEPFSPNLITYSTEATAIAERLEELLIRRIPMPSREACREYAATNFDWQKIAQQVRQVLLS